MSASLRYVFSRHPLEQEVEVDVTNVAKAEDGRPMHVERLPRVGLVQHEVDEGGEGGPLRARHPPLVLSVRGAELGDHLPTQLIVVGSLIGRRGGVL